MPVAVRPFCPEEAGLLAAIRLDALADSPDAFAERLDMALAKGGEDFSQALAEGAVWGVFQENACVGMAGFDRHVGANVAHKATIWGVYLQPRTRGSGAAEALFRALIGHARRIGVEALHLGVGDFNQPARRFYERMGFAPYGFERRALKIGDRYVDEIQMVLFLGPD
jgi:RimJ/RimL family protein N-acetyltransferase